MNKHVLHIVMRTTGVTKFFSCIFIIILFEIRPLLITTQTLTLLIKHSSKSFPFFGQWCPRDLYSQWLFLFISYLSTHFCFLSCFLYPLEIRLVNKLIHHIGDIRIDISYTYSLVDKSVLQLILYYVLDVFIFMSSIT